MDDIDQTGQIEGDQQVEHSEDDDDGTGEEKMLELELFLKYFREDNPKVKHPLKEYQVPEDLKNA
jgi:hypothetical protein